VRRKRYSEKLEWVEKEISFMSELAEHAMKDEVSKRAILYSLQTAVEAVMDIVAMLVKDVGLEVEDDYTNISKLVDERIIDEEEGATLRRFNGLRNAIAHHYNHLDLSRVEEALNFVDDLYRIAVKLVKTAESFVE